MKRNGMKYDTLGYKRLILDYHFSEFNPVTLENADADEIVEAMKRLKIDSLLLYAKDHWGNIYHETDRGHMHRNVQFDLFGRVLEGLKEAGIETIAYTTVCWDEQAAREHPEWCARDADGKPMRLGSDEDTHAKWTLLCVNTGYRGYFLEQVRELAEKYDFAALFLDILMYWSGETTCYCANCRRLWKERHGGAIPREPGREDAARYLDMVTDLQRDFYRAVRETVRAAGRDVLFTHNYGTFYDLDDYVAMEFDGFGRDYFGPSLRAKTYRARAGGGEVELIGHRFNQTWDFTTKPVPLLEWEAATVIAHDCALMYVDQPHIRGDLDPRALENMRKAFETAEELAPHVEGTEPYAEIALLDCERSMALDGGENLDQAGAHKAFTELHYAFDVVDCRRISAETLKKYSLLVIPRGRCLDGETREGVKAYVEAGGAVLFCHRTGFADEDGRALEEPLLGLVEPLGDSGHKINFIKPCFELADTRVKVKEFEAFRAPDGAEILATYTPPCIDVTATQWVSHQPGPGVDSGAAAVVLGRCGRGRFAYAGARVFREYLEQDQPSIRGLIRHCVERLAAPRLGVAAPRSVEAVYCRKGSELRVFLINGTMGKPCAQVPMPGISDAFCMHMNLDEIIPLADMRVRFRGATIKSGRNLAGESLPVSGDSVVLPRLGLYDVVTLEVEEWRK